MATNFTNEESKISDIRDQISENSRALHKPVLLKEVVHYLNPQSNQNFIDGTIGGGGHAFSILDLTEPDGKLLGIDWSREAIENLNQIKIQKPKLNRRLILAHGNFISLNEVVKKEKFFSIHGIILDLGLSSDLLENSGRGFSFKKDERLDMRFDAGTESPTAEIILNHWSEEELIKIFRNFGEERFSSLIANAIIRSRKGARITTTFQLVELIKKALGRRFHQKSVARIFQALRIAVNHELENLEMVLLQAVDILSPDGKLVVISYHSLEDRIVKRFFKANPHLTILTKKPVRPTAEEIKNNPRARSAKLRAAVLTP